MYLYNSTKLHDASNECKSISRIRLNLQNGDPLPLLEKKVFGRAKARIDTGLFTQGEACAEVIMTTTPPPEAKPDQTIERYILVALSYLRKSFPSNFKVESIEIDGLCDLAGITKDQYLYNAQILLEKGFIKEGDVDQLSVENGGVYITVGGLNH